MLKKLSLVLICLIALITPALGQSMSVTATLTDPDSTVWVNGTCSIQLYNGQSIGYQYNGVAVPIAPACSINSSGVLSATMYNTSTMSPVAAQYQLNICSDTSAPCSSFLTTVTTTNQTSAFSALLVAPRFSAVYGSFGYSDVEVKNAVSGAYYYNVTTDTLRQYNGTSWANIGSGGGSGVSQIVAGTNITISPTNGLGAVTVNSSGGGLGAVIANTQTPANTTMMLTPANPTSPGAQDVIMGVGAAPNMSDGGNSTSGQHSVFIGYHAGASATTMRESVVVGAEACPTVTGVGGGTADDDIAVCIGSYAASAATATNSDVLIGQKVFESGTSATGDVMIGTHNGTGLVSSASDVLIGDRGFDTSTANITSQNNTLLGVSYGAHTGTLGSASPHEMIGLGALLYPEMQDGNDDIAIGYNAGGSGGSYNQFIGAFSGTSPSAVINIGHITGTENMCYGNSTCQLLTSGSNNTFFGSPAGANITTGSGNSITGWDAASSLSTGSDNAIYGAAAGQHLGAASSNFSIFGTVAAPNATGSDGSFFGFESGASLTSTSGNSFFGDESAKFMTTGSQNSCFGWQCLENNITDTGDTAFGYNAQILNGVSNAVQIGTGLNSTANTWAVGDGTHEFNFGDMQGNFSSQTIKVAGLGVSAAPLCTTTGGLLTNSGCNGISGATTGQVLIAGSANTATSSKVLAGSGAGITTGPTTTVTTDLATYTGTGGQLADSSVALASVALLASPTFTGTPAAPTATSGTNTTQLATTAFVQTATARTANIATLVSGTVTVSTAAACTPGATCTYKLTNCALNGSTAVGVLSVGAISVGTSFVINSYTALAALAVDSSKVCWQIN